MKYFLKSILIKVLKRFNLLVLPKHKYEDWLFRYEQYSKLDTMYEEYDEGLQYLNRGRVDAYDNVLEYLKDFNKIENEKDSIRNCGL